MAVFHLSLPVPHVEESVAFFELLGGVVMHRDPSGYVNVGLSGVQLTLQEGTPVASDDAFHFGLNVARGELDEIAARLRASDLARIVSPLHVVDAGTPMERTKMYVRCPAGYRIELKGYGA